MKIKDILAQDKPVLSFEVFPPKEESAFETVETAAFEIAKLSPAFMSVTYGAGGGTSKYTVDIASDLKKNFGVTALAHLTCVSSSKEHVHQVVERLKEHDIQNIMALRGDIPKEGRLCHDYTYACELIGELKSMGDFCIGGACYPEGHPEARTKAEDILHLKEKVDAGCDFLTTQMFFDNDLLYNFLYQIREKGITVPVVAGIMPVTNAKQMKKIIAMSDAQIPAKFRAIIDKFGHNPAAMQQAGVAYATDQIVDLIANGVNAVHVYSMNKPEVAAQIKNSLSEIIV